ncbi:hypothetical protein SOVF_186200 [Spinacia oleracea]|uniref:DNL-type domain-containing protein n=1 Tax=Spinacia oleracea TaxID=3562 RepID=A0A9R0IZQ1_SPIOL|nr:uncharacterized protein LOC110796608 [Spinacia oleracea]KNA05863.1 hypothetical protein SOVF_186200 [Spinacia oleracea]
MTTTALPAIFSLLSSSSCYYPTKSTLVLPPSFIPFNFSPKSNPRLRISHKVAVSFKNQRHWLPSCCSGNAEINPDTIDDSSKESSINVQLPRRSLLVQFTCNACGERTKRLINRLAYERGTVFVQCAGCLKHHKLVDNLGLVVEYDFRNDTDQD